MHEDEIKKIDKEIEYLSNSDSDGDMYRISRLLRIRYDIITKSQEVEVLNSRNIKFEIISGGFIIISPINYKRYYYYSFSKKWRVEGKSKYYLCKDLNDLLDRFIIGTSRIVEEIK